MTNVHIQPPICTDRALELSWKDSNIRYLDHLGNSDIAISSCQFSWRNIGPIPSRRPTVPNGSLPTVTLTTLSECELSSTGRLRPRPYLIPKSTVWTERRRDQRAARGPLSVDRGPHAATGPLIRIYRPLTRHLSESHGRVSYGSLRTDHGSAEQETEMSERIANPCRPPAGWVGPSGWPLAWPS